MVPLLQRLSGWGPVTLLNNVDVAERALDLNARLFTERSPSQLSACDSGRCSTDTKSTHEL
jgi:hypothetical protein